MTLAQRLRGAVTDTPADFILTGDDWNAGELAGMTPAAVLVAIVDRPSPGLILTVRTDNLRHHAGQIAFPSGRNEPGETAVDAALREAGEEIALDPACVDMIGTGDPYRTITNFVVTPVIAIVPPDLPLHPSDGEVGEWFEAPLDFVTDPGRHQVRTVDWQGRRRSYYEIFWEGRRIWGATAAMIVNLSRRLTGSA